MKYFIYVEGYLEAYFLKQLLHSIYLYDASKYGFRIIEESGANTFEENCYGDSKKSEFFYVIRIVGGDEKVTSSIKDNLANQNQDGFIVLGLRDVYSQGYQELFKRRRPGTLLNYDSDVVTEFTHKNLESFRLLFDIDFKDILIFQQMEIEAWLLGLIHFSSNFDFSLPSQGEHLSDPAEIYHPASTLESMLLELGKITGEWKGSSNYISVTSQLHKSDFESLYLSDICLGFKVIYKKLGLDNF